jgi:triacylglycerol lipase
MPEGLPRAVVAEFNGERVVGRTWPLKENHISVLELTY